MTTRLPLALTLGDPAGVGPELTAVAWKSLNNSIPFVAIGDAAYLSQIAVSAGVPVKTIDQPEQIHAGRLCVIDCPAGSEISPGFGNQALAPSIVRSIELAVNMVRSGKAGGLVTNPINKKILVDGAGFKHAGHTEFLAELDDAKHVVMMLVSGKFRVVPTTVHVSLAEVPTLLTCNLLERTIRITHGDLVRRFGIERPSIWVTGLNPHAGEGGLMGNEEMSVITPVLEQLRGDGMNISGPKSADTMFHEAVRSEYEAAICMYHDQALIPLKTVGFADGVNTTLGLSFVRTSPDHGTAYDIAGKGLADPRSLIAAIELADQLRQPKA